MMHKRIVNGGEQDCQRKRNGRRQLGEQMEESFLGEMNLLPAMAKHTRGVSQLVHLPVLVSPSLVASAMGISIITGSVTGFILGQKTSKMKPADIFRQL